jgi:hypothetical protein
MEFKTLKPDTAWESINGTSLKGHIQEITRRELEAIFGPPSYFDANGGADGKVTTEWCLLINDDTVATIYDWKRYEDGAPGMDEKCEWNIGGHGPDVVDLVLTKIAKEQITFSS